MVESERLFIKVAEQMKRLNAHIGAAQGSLHEAPKVLNAVGMDDATDVFFGVIDNLVNVGVGQVRIGGQGVGKHFAARDHILPDFGGQARASAVRDDASPNRAMTVWPMPSQETKHGGLVDSTCPGDLGDTLVFVHVTGLATDECFVHFNLPTEWDGELVLHSEPDAMHHEPSGLLGDAQGATDFIGGNAILVIDDHPHSGEPFVQPERAILEDGPNLDRELTLGMPALATPKTPSSDKANLNATAGWAGNTVRPAENHHKGKASVGISEIPDGFEQGFGFVLHDCALLQIESITAKPSVSSRLLPLQGLWGQAERRRTPAVPPMDEPVLAVDQWTTTVADAAPSAVPVTHLPTAPVADANLSVTE